MPTGATRNRILDAAEVLFAQQGFSETSLRDITQQAEVNLASVNYHFGSKLGLIQSVLDRYLSVYLPRLEDEFTRLDAEHNRSVSTLLNVFIVSLLSLQAMKPQAPTLFVQLLGRAYIDGQGHLRSFIRDHYGPILMHLSHKCSLCIPTLDRESLFWRLHFALGTCVFSMASFSSLSDIAQTDFGQNTDLSRLFEKLLPFLAGGLIGSAG